LSLPQILPVVLLNVTRGHSAHATADMTDALSVACRGFAAGAHVEDLSFGQYFLCCILPMHPRKGGMWALALVSCSHADRKAVSASFCWLVSNCMCVD
jgi:hypothetical protein